MYELHQGDNLTALRLIADNSIDSIVCDPQYGLGKEPDALAMLRDWLEKGHHDHKSKRGFMGKEWDAFVPQPALWAECFRVLKPGGYLLAFAGTRTQHLMALGLQIAGFEIRDMIAWVYGSGFPKSKNLDGEWQGWGTALKPALEPITVARKPLVGTVADNVLQFGTGGLNIEGCRIEGRERTDYGLTTAQRSQGSTYGAPSKLADFDSSKGRWPANLIHDGSDEVVALFPETRARGNVTPRKRSTAIFGSCSESSGETDGGDSGSAARFFYCAKASKRDRDEGLEGFAEQRMKALEGGKIASAKTPDALGGERTGRNSHPTVKPTDLMRYLCRLVTPPGGTVLDPFMGSGSTGKAAMLEGFRFVGIDRSEEYVAIAQARIAAAVRQVAEELAG